MRAPAAVAVDDDLAARHARIAVRPPDHELAGRVHVQDVVVAYQLAQAVAGALQPRLGSRNQDGSHILADLVAHGLLRRLLASGLLRRDELVVLRRNDDRMHALRTIVIAVLDRHLAFRVGPQIGHHPALAPNGGQFFHQHMRENQRSRHQLTGLGAGVPEHDALIAGSLQLLALSHDALIDVGRLLVNGRQHAARAAVELVVAFRVADPIDHAPGHLLYVDIGLRAHLARHDDQSRRTERFAGYLRMIVMTKKLVENRIGNLVRYLVGMSLGHRLGRKQKSHFLKF